MLSELQFKRLNLRHIGHMDKVLFATISLQKLRSLAVSKSLQRFHLLNSLCQLMLVSQLYNALQFSWGFRK